jgi:hypothetical protein
VVAAVARSSRVVASREDQQRGAASVGRLVRA